MRLPRQWSNGDTQSLYTLGGGGAGGREGGFIALSAIKRLVAVDGELGGGLPGEAVAARVRPSLAPELVVLILHGFAGDVADSCL